MKAFWLAIIELYQKQLLLAKLGKMGGEFWFSELWPRLSNVTVHIVIIKIYKIYYSIIKFLKPKTSIMIATMIINAQLRRYLCT